MREVRRRLIDFSQGDRPDFVPARTRRLLLEEVSLLREQGVPEPSAIDLSPIRGLEVRWANRTPFLWFDGELGSYAFLDSCGCFHVLDSCRDQIIGDLT